MVDFWRTGFRRDMSMRTVLIPRNKKKTRPVEMMIMEMRITAVRMAQDSYRNILNSGTFNLECVTYVITRSSQERISLIDDLHIQRAMVRLQLQETLYPSTLIP
jgi:hypothetical protein